MRKILSFLSCVLLVRSTMPRAARAQAAPKTPIQHLVVIFGEIESFDHYFGTYPHALNLPGEPRFTALPGTPAVNGLSGSLLTNNPNSNPANDAGASNPFRLGDAQALTADQGMDIRRNNLHSTISKWTCFHQRQARLARHQKDIPPW